MRVGLELGGGATVKYNENTLCACMKFFENKISYFKNCTIYNSVN